MIFFFGGIWRDFVYFNFVEYHLNITCHGHICNCWFMNNISYTIYKKFIIHFHSEFYTPSSSGPLVITVKVEGKWKFSHGHHIVLLYSTHKNNSQKFIF
jgi:hypothetical protein